MVGATVIMLVSMLFTSLVCCQCLADRVVTLPFSKFTKLDKPILEPTGYGFDAAAVYNPAVVYVNGTFYMFYRAQAK